MIVDLKLNIADGRAEGADRLPFRFAARPFQKS